LGFREIRQSLTVDKEEAAIDDLGGDDAPEAALRRHLLEIQSIIADANGRTWKQRQRDLNNYEAQPVDFKLMSHHSSDRAYQHILDASQGRNILTICALEGLSNNFAIRLYETLTHNGYKAIVQGAVIVHLLLAFFQPVSLEKLSENGTRKTVLFIECKDHASCPYYISMLILVHFCICFCVVTVVCILLEFVHMAGLAIITYGYKTENLLHGKVGILLTS
jgi:hypothetical protein